MDSTTAAPVDIDNVTEKVKEYAELSKVIKLTQEKLKILNQKKRELHKEVIPKLKTINITKCNLSYGTLKVIKTNRKVVPTKTTIKDKYLIFFNTKALEQAFIQGTPQERTDIIHKFIYVDCAETKQNVSISMTYNKEFKENMKQLTLNI